MCIYINIHIHIYIKITTWIVDTAHVTWGKNQNIGSEGKVGKGDSGASRSTVSIRKRRSIESSVLSPFRTRITKSKILS